MKKGLFIGRFQPFHNAHLADIRLILKECESVIIGIGSSQYSRTKDNPFSIIERKEMITSALKEEGITDYEIKEIPDIHDDLNWVDHVIKIVGKFDKVYTGNDWTEDLFKKTAYQLKKIDLIPNISSTIVREKMLNKKEWKHMVPKKVKEYLEIKQCEKIIKTINERVV